MSTKAQKREQKKRRKKGSLNEIEYVCAIALKKHSLHSRQRARAHPGSRRQLHRTRVRSKRRERTSSPLLVPYFCCRWETPVFLNDERRREEEKVLFTLFVSRGRRGARREERRRRVWMHYIYVCICMQICSSSRERCKCSEKVFCLVFFEQLSHASTTTPNFQKQVGCFRAKPRHVF